MDRKSVGIGYTVATGHLFCPFDEFQVAAEEILGRPVLTHEFGQPETWDELREALKQQLPDEFGGS